jgi:hypothetical protein
MGIVDTGGLRSLRQSAFELMVLNLELIDSMFGNQSTVAPPLPAAVDFVASLPEAATLFATPNRPLFPHLSRFLDATEILAFLSRHHPIPLIKEGPSTKHEQTGGSRLALSARAQTLRACPLGSNHAERTFYNLLEFSTA